MAPVRQGPPSRGVELRRLPLVRFRAVCGRVADDAWDRFTRALERRGKGRLRVAGHIEAGGKVVATFSGAYVALQGE